MKILVWNIQFFTKRRIEPRSEGFDEDPDAEVEDFLRTLANITYITSTVRQAAPDIFVIVEPQASQGAVSSLAAGGGPDGLLHLLGDLRKYMEGTDWRLVPPLLLNPQDHLASKTYTECIGVFWNDKILQFTGPWVWTANGAWPGGVGVAYDAPWKAAVPDGNTAAGQCLFSDGKSGSLGFPKAWNRRPFLTRFTERATGRVLKLYSVHTTPASAADAVAQMREIRGMSPGDGEITVVTGDFNVDLNSDSTEASQQLTWLGVDQRLQLVKTPSSHSFLKTVYETTRVKARTKATWANYKTKKAIDYAFVGYGKGARQPPEFQPTVAVVDRVAGTPSPPFDADMQTALAEYPTIQPTEEDPDLALTTFLSRWNYGHIAQPQRADKTDDTTLDGTSDHLPILVTV
ncbi:hypothetical protein BE20_58125 [Sorangium cellulosum]|nr:hypothetical protein BE20_58125 [Sorangium cellulosum]